MNANVKLLTAVTALVVLTLVLRGGTSGVLIALGVGAVVVWRVITTRRSSYVLPRHRLYSIALSKAVEDGPGRTAAFINDVHHLSREHPVLLAYVADAETHGEAPRLEFVVGLRDEIDRAAKPLLDVHFSGAGVVVSEITDLTEFPLYRRAVAEFRRLAAAAELQAGGVEPAR